jgi:cobalt-zinc-cadmium efflux system outer membrane protein
MDFLLPQKGARARARASAALETQAAASDVGEVLWRVRADVRQGLLDAVYANDTTVLLKKLVADREALLSANRTLAEAGEIASSETLTQELELARARQRLMHSEALAVEAQVRLAGAVGVPVAALEGIPIRWGDWAQIAALNDPASKDWRSAALVGRPKVVRAVHEYDLSDIALQSEVAKRWPQFHVSPGYSWDKSGLHQQETDEVLHDTLHDNELGVSLEIPIFNQHQGSIGEALARRELAGRHLQAVQAEIFGEIERAERAWPQAREAWRSAAGAQALAERQRDAEARALSAGSSERAALLAAQLAATEAQLASLEAAYDAQMAFASLENAYRRPLQATDQALEASS